MARLASSSAASSAPPIRWTRQPACVSAPRSSRCGSWPAQITTLSTVLTVFEDFTYHRELASEDGLSVVLEFSARVGEKKLKGIDLIRFDEQGRIVEFEVMVRPMSGLQALGAEMGARLGHLLPSFKAAV